MNDDNTSTKPLAGISRMGLEPCYVALFYFLYSSQINKMKDKDFAALMRKTQIAGLKHKKLLDQLEEEYFARYGQYPCDVDDDFFIDAFDYCQGDLPTLEQVHESATLFL